MDNPAIDYPGIDGFLGSRASLMLDVVFVAMFVVVPVLAWSVWQVKYRRRYQLHKTVQIVLAVVLLVAVTLFEVDMQLVSGWEARATTTGSQPAAHIYYALWVHLVFAVTAVPLWVFVIVRALRIGLPGTGSGEHIFWARLAAIDMCLTAVTGWVFYWLAFVA